MKQRVMAVFLILNLLFSLCCEASAEPVTITMESAAGMFDVNECVYVDNSDVFTDFTVEFNLTIKYSSNRNRLPQVILKNNGNSRYSVYFDNYSAKSTIGIGRTVGGAEERLGYAEVDLNAYDGAAVPVKIITEGCRICVYYNDMAEPVVDIYDKKYLTAGLTGFDCGNSSMSVGGFKISEFENKGSGNFISNAEIRASKLLDALGIMEYSADGKFYPEKPVTRREFAVMLIKLIGIEGISSSDSNYMFDDIPTSDPEAACINTVAARGLMKAADNRRFLPDEPLSRDDAVYALVNVLGYERISGSADPYSRASAIGLFKNVREEFNRAAAAVIIYNALTAETVEQASYGSLEGFEIKSGGTLLNKIFKTEKVTLRITANSMTSLDGKDCVNDGNVRLGDTVYSVGTTDIADYIGYTVNAYVKTENGEDHGTVLSFDTDKTKELIVTSDLIETGSDRRLLRYCIDEDSDTIKTASISNTADFIVNGSAVSPGEDVFSLKNAEVKLLDSQNDSVYDTVIISKYEVRVVDDFYSRGFVITDVYKNPQIRPVDINNDKFEFYLNGNEITIRQLKRFDVLELLRLVSSDGERVINKVFVTRKSISGKIDNVEYEGDDVSAVTVGGELFKTSEYYRDSAGNAPKIFAGEEFNVYLDKNGKVAAAFPVVNDSIALLNNIKYTKSSISPCYKVEIMTLKREWLILELDNNITVNNSKYNLETDAGRNALMSFLTDGGICKKQLVYIKYYDDVVKEIMTAGNQNERDKDPIWSGKTISNKAYSATNGSFESDIFIDSSTVVVSIPESGQKSDYYVGGISHLINGAKHTFTYYNEDKFNVADYILLDEEKCDSSSSVIQYFFVVDSTSIVLNNDGELVIQVDGFLNNRPDSFITKDLTTFSELKRGDVIEVYNDFRGAGDSFKLHYSSSGDKVYKNNANTSLASDLVTVSGDVLAFDVNTGRILLNTGVEHAYRLIGNAGYYLYERKADKLRVADIGEICEGDFVFMSFYWNEARNVVIIRD